MRPERNYKAEEPHDFGFARPELFAELGDAFYQITKSAVWQRGKERQNRSSELLRIMADITERLCHYVGESTGKAPSVIIHAVSTESIGLGGVQRTAARLWHVDGDNDKPRPILLMAANNMTTEFLVRKQHEPLIRARQNELLEQACSGYSFDTDMIQQGIDMGLFDVHSPEPLQMVINHGNIHRSPKNTVASIVNRVWWALQVKE